MTRRKSVFDQIVRGQKDRKTIMLEREGTRLLERSKEVKANCFIVRCKGGQRFGSKKRGYKRRKTSGEKKEKNHCEENKEERETGSVG